MNIYWLTFVIYSFFAYIYLMLHFAKCKEAKCKVFGGSLWKAFFAFIICGGFTTATMLFFVLKSIKEEIQKNLGNQLPKE